MRYRFYVNVERDAEGRPVGFFGCKPEHEMELAYRGELLDQCVRSGPPTEAERLHACEELFRIFNIQHPKDYRNRSMSVGDVVLLMDGTDLYAYRCDFCGFSEIDSGVFCEVNARDLVPGSGLLGGAKEDEIGA